MSYVKMGFIFQVDYPQLDVYKRQVKGDKELKGVTAQNIYTFYKEMMEDIDKLPEEIKNMVRCV